MRTLRNVSRGILIFTNVLFLLLGAVLVTLGGYMISIPDLNAFSDGGISSGIIACGLLILAIAFLGYCGAHWDSKVFLCPYAILVVVSVITQLSLAGFLFHIHGSLVTIARHHFDVHVLSRDDRKLLEWINARFADAYANCGLHVDVDLSWQERSLLATCTNQDYDWFAAFVETNCRLSWSDLNPTSDFLNCVGSAFDVKGLKEGKQLDQHALLCACESRMIDWVNDQSLLIAVFLFGICFFEILLVLSSCYVMCTRRRRQGYQEIRMPIKQQHPFNPHPRNYTNSSAQAYHYHAHDMTGAYGQPPPQLQYHHHAAGASAGFGGGGGTAAAAGGGGGGIFAPFAPSVPMPVAIPSMYPPVPSQYGNHGKEEIQPILGPSI